MSSDYIPRLRRELLRAGASHEARRRPARIARGLRPLAAAAVVALLAVAVVLALSGGLRDETSAGPAAGTVHLTYGVEPPGAAEQTAEILRERLGAAGIEGAGVSAASSGSLTISAPARARANVTALTAEGRLAIYDWERSVLGPGTSSQADAEARAAAHPGSRVVRVLTGQPDRWFALAGDPALTGADVASARPAVDDVTGEPIVRLELTAGGQTAFGTLTRDLARRGSAEAGGAGGAEGAFQHLAIVLDGQVLSMPYINFREAPDGIDGSAGMRTAVQITGGLTPRTARQIAAIVGTGPLPATLSGQATDQP
jgi:preprotein translocase subunit SecD